MKREHDALNVGNEKLRSKGVIKKALVWGTAAVALAGGGVVVKGYVDGASEQAQNQEYTRLSTTAGKFADIILNQYDEGKNVKMRKTEGGDLLGGLIGDDYRDGTVTVSYSGENPSELDVSFSADVVGVYNNGNGTSIDVSEIVTFETPSNGVIRADTGEISVRDLQKIVDNATLTSISIINTPTDKSIKGQSADFGLKLNSGTGKFETYSIGSLGGPNVSEIITTVDSFNKNLTNQHNA